MKKSLSLELSKLSKPKQKSNRFQFDSWWGAVVEEVRTIFAELNDATIYIPDLREKVAV